MSRLIDQHLVRSTIDHPLLAGVKQRGKAARVELSHSSASVRLLPSAILVGSQRCGTTALTSALFRSPSVVRPRVGKGAHYFSLNYWRPFEWYRAQFPTVAHSAWVRGRHGNDLVAMDACPYYLFHPFAAERIARDLPDARLLVMLRDPVARAQSHHKHEVSRNFEDVADFADALDLEPTRLEGEVDAMAVDPAYHSHAWEKYSYLAKGQYVDQLERLFSFVPREQVMVIQAEAYFADQARWLAEVCDFIGVDRVSPASADRRNGYDYADMAPALKSRLVGHFAPYNERLFELLGEEWDWPK